MQKVVAAKLNKMTEDSNTMASNGKYLYFLPFLALVVGLETFQYTCIHN